MANQFAFVGCGEDGQQTAADKAQVRSYCMRGRNKRQGSRRSIQEAKQTEKRAARANATVLHPLLSDDALVSTSRYRPLSINPDLPAVGSWIVPGAAFGPTIARIAHAVDKTPQSLFHQVTTFDRATEASYPIVACVDFGNGQADDACGLPYFDDAFLHSVLLATSTAASVAQRQPLTKSARFHLASALPLLNRKLAHVETYLEDSTLFTVLLLAIVATGVGDYSASGAHMAGLRRLVELRGGRERLRKDPVLQFKLECLDLRLCLSLGSAPQFLRGPVSWESDYAGQSPIVDTALSLALFNERFDPRLVAAFRDLQQLVATVNDRRDDKARLHATEFMPVLGSIQTRLLHLRDLLADTPSEWLCLGMLAFLTTMFRILGKRLVYKHLAGRVRRACRDLKASSQDMRDIVHWVMVVACGATDLDTREAWLRTSWLGAAGPSSSWEEAQSRLRRVMWIGCIQDGAGKRAFEALTMQGCEDVCSTFPAVDRA